jgi:hypothetical protein
MNFLLVRLVLWFVTLAVFPVPVTLVPRSFEVEVLQRITLAALPPSLESERTSVELTERVLVHLEKAENQEIDPWLRDDIRIAWITAKWSQHGVPDWSLHGDQAPYVAATWQVLHCHPDQVWPRLVAQRKEKLGLRYEQVWGEGSPPRKPVESVRLRAASRKRLAA